MRGWNRNHWIAVTLTLGLVVLLLFAPHHSGKFQTEASVAAVPDVEYRIDSALRMINGPQPMQGILQLRQVAEEHPGNFRAQYHLGRFSAQTGQWDKVIERFTEVRKIDPGFAETDYWLGKAYFEIDSRDEAKTSLERFLETEENNDELIRDAQTMLNQLK